MVGFYFYWQRNPPQADGNEKHKSRKPVWAGSEMQVKTLQQMGRKEAASQAGESQFIGKWQPATQESNTSTSDRLER